MPGKVWVEDAQGHPKQVDAEAEDYQGAEQFSGKQAADLNRQIANRDFAQQELGDTGAAAVGLASGLTGGLSDITTLLRPKLFGDEDNGIYERRLMEGLGESGSYKGGQAAGIVGGAVLGDEFGLLGTAGGAAERMAGRLLPEVPGMLGTAGKAALKLAARGGTEGALLNISNTVQDKLIQNHPLTAEALAASGLDGALMGGLAGVTVGGIGSILGKGVENLGARKASSIMKSTPAVEKTATDAYGALLEREGVKLTDSVSKIRAAGVRAEADFAKIRQGVVENLDAAGTHGEGRVATERIAERAKIELSPDELKAVTKSFDKSGLSGKADSWKSLMEIRDRVQDLASAGRPGAQKMIGIIDSEMTAGMKAAEVKTGMKGLTDQYTASYLGGRMARELQEITEATKKSGKLFSMTPQEMAHAAIWTATGHPGAAIAHAAARGSGKIASTLMGGKRAATQAIPKSLGEAVVRNASAARAAANVQAVTARISNAVRGFFKAGRAATNLTAGSADRYSREHYEKQAESARDLVSGPHASRVNDYAGTDLANVHPELSKQLVGVYQRGAEYIGPLIPASRKSQQSNSLRQLPMPKQLDMKEFKFLRINNAIRHPMSLIDKVEDGTISRDEAAALKYVYPELHAQIVESAQTEIMAAKEAGEYMSVDKITKLGLILGAPVDTILTPDYISGVQAALHAAPEGQSQPQQGNHVPNQQGPGMVDVVGNSGLLTPIDKAVLVS